MVLTLVKTILITAPTTIPVKLILRQQYSVEITSYVKQIADMVCELEPDVVDSSKIENNIVRCPDQKLAEEMIKKIELKWTNEERDNWIK